MFKTTEINSCLCALSNCEEPGQLIK